MARVVPLVAVVTSTAGSSQRTHGVRGPSGNVSSPARVVRRQRLDEATASVARSSCETAHEASSRSASADGLPAGAL